jgi:two-component system chemotaxis sensor kinase CheA
MTSAEQSLPDLLRGVRADLEVAWTQDSATLARPRAKLAWIASTLPAQRAEARRLLDLAAEAASAIGISLASNDDDLRVLAAVRAAVVAAAEHLSEPDDLGRELLLIQAGQQLLHALGRDPGEWLRGASAAIDGEPASVAHAELSLDDAAALLFMIEPHEHEEMERIRSSLATLAADDAELPDVRALSADAVRLLAVVTDGSVADAERSAALSEVVELVANVVRVRDDAQNASLAAPAAPHHATPRSVEQAPPVQSRSVAPSAAADMGADVEDVLPEGDRELIGDFVAECREYLESAESALLKLEVNPTDIEAINTVFRAFHTVKGTSGFLGLDVITTFTHEAESLFSRVRDREVPFAGEIPNVALRAVDVVKGLVSSVQQALAGAKMTRPANYAAVLAELARLTSGDESAEAPVPGVAAQRSSGPVSMADVPPDVELVKRAAESPASGGRGAGAREAWSGEERRAANGGAREVWTAEERRAAAAGAESSIRVRTDRLDRLIDMIAELVIAQTMIAQDPGVPSAGHHGLSRKVSHAGKIVRELHDLSLSMRMVPLKPTFQKMTRLVRDVAQQVGKEVEFVTEGEETEIDRNMVDALSDPLVHMVRNAVDHGIELPEVRVQAGKPRHGTVRLSASHAGGTVVVQLRDDGRGLDTNRIVAKAIEKGLIESGANLTEPEIYNLIFAPGFSTNEQVTGLSGRGVGMDVVRRNIESLRGRIEIGSEPGGGTVFTVRLPLTLAVTDGMLVQVGGERYVIPTTNIFKSFRPDPDALTTVAGRGEMVRLRDEVMPMFRLHRLFNVMGAQEDPCAGLVVIVEIGAERVALLVDALLGQQQVVAKSLGNGIGKIHGVSGGAILGDGRVGLILDIPELLVLIRSGDDGLEPLRAVA